MYHWSISEPEGYNWSFCVKDGDRIIVDRIPCLELHVEYQQQNIMRMIGSNGDEYHVPTGPRLGEIHLFHQVENEYVQYIEELFDNSQNVTMELSPNTMSDTINRFTGARMISANYHFFS